MADLIPMLAAVAGQAGEEADEDFNQTVLLLHGDGTNGAQNNTFLDSSTNNFTITRNGNTTQGTFSPFSVAEGEWSNYFDGSGDYLSLTGSSLGSGNITLEFWVYLPTSGVGIFFDSRASDVSSTGFAFYRNSSNYLAMFTDGTGTAGTTVIPTNQWVHLALVRNSGTFYGYMNGVQQFTRANSATMSLTSWKIFAQYDNTNLATGYLSNFRLTTTAVYTSAFTPPTAPLTAISNTSLLTCQSNRFVDNSTNAFAITRNGDVRVTPFSPFAPSAAYSASTNGGSGYFDGSGDYLTATLTNNPNSNIFTFEAWVFANSFDTVNGNHFFQIDTASNSNIALTQDAGGWRFLLRNDSTVDVFNLTGGTARTGTWFHVVGVKDGANAALFVNGTRISSTTSATVSPTTTGKNIKLGFNAAAAPRNWHGYIANARYVEGTAIYDPTQTTLTVPTAPLTAISNTTFLANFTNAGIFDNTGKNNLETVGNAQIDTTTKKFGTGSLEFDGVSDELKIPSSTLLDFEGDFTVEFWVYFNTLEDSMRLFNRQVYTSSPNIELVTKADGSLIARLNDTAANPTTVSSTGVLTTGTWQHIAFVRYGSATDNVNVYVDGVAKITFTKTGACNPNAALLIGNYPGLDRTPDAFIDDFRVTKVARYTANFTAPTKAFPDQ